jgi:hypothetical protein
VNAPPDVQSERIANFTKSLMVATVALGVATLLLFVTGCVQAGLLLQQIKLSRAEFMASNRPRIALCKAYLANPIAGASIEAKCLRHSQRVASVSSQAAVPVFVRCLRASTLKESPMRVASTACFDLIG